MILDTLPFLYPLLFPFLPPPLPFPHHSFPLSFPNSQPLLYSLCLLLSFLSGQTVPLVLSLLERTPLTSLDHHVLCSVQLLRSFLSISRLFSHKNDVVNYTLVLYSFLIIRASEQTGYLFLTVLSIQMHLWPSQHSNQLEKYLMVLFWKRLYQTAWFSGGLFFKFTFLSQWLFKKYLSIFRMINMPFWIAKHCHNLIFSYTCNCTGSKESGARLIS